MKASAFLAISSLAFFAIPLSAQDEGASDNEGAEVIVTGTRIAAGRNQIAIPAPPVIGIKRIADSAVRNIEIISDSREEDMRKREVQAMLLAAIDLAKREGMSLVTGQFEVVEVTRANWQDQFAGLVIKDDDAADDEDEEDDEDDDDENKPKPAFEDNGNSTIIRLKVKAKLVGSIDNVEQKIKAFLKKVPVTGRSVIEKKSGTALTIINPEQYRDEIYRKISSGAKHAVTFYGTEYGLNVTGLDNAIAWKQVSNTQVFLYIPYSFSVEK
jgi:hypothetical protein